MKILDNVTARFKNLSGIFHNFPSVLEALETRYLTIASFFEAYNGQVAKTEDPEDLRAGPAGIINFIYHSSVKNRIHPIDFTRVPGIRTYHNDTINFLYALENEFKQAT